MLEVCVDSAEGAVAAARAGADYIELCSSLPEGGLTPSAGLLRIVKNRVNQEVKINAMIRCRAGTDFHYSDSELETMLADIEIFKSMQVDGLVFGALTKNQEIDKAACSRIIAKAGSTSVTFHRAFDICKDPMNSLETVIKLGFKKILTSGQSSSACSPEGVQLISELHRKSNGRIIIMPGAGITEENVNLLSNTGAKYFHSSCKVTVVSPVINGLAMGTGESCVTYLTDDVKVKSLKRVLSNLYGANLK